MSSYALRIQAPEADEKPETPTAAEYRQVASAMARTLEGLGFGEVLPSIELPDKDARQAALRVAFKEILKEFRQEWSR